MHRKAQPTADVLYVCGGWALGVIGEDYAVGDGCGKGGCRWMYGKSTGEAGFIDRIVDASEQYLKHNDELLVGGKEWKS